MSQKPISGMPGLVWLLLFLMILLCYVTGLDSLYLPSNGDEMVYSRIARLTAESTHWLPLVSDLNHMRNTKPPVLFWQAMVAGDWAHHWDLWRLRLPAVLYSLVVACGVGTLAARLSRQRVTGFVAACVYLVFFSSFRYGRPYLTSAAETFWLCAPLAWVVWRTTRPAAGLVGLPHGAAFVLVGLAWGVGLLYKSFALVLPAGAGLWCALMVLHWPLPSHALPGHGRWRDAGMLALQACWRVALSGVIALGVFALWFVVDPDPQAVWQEFVVGENVGKLATTTLSASAKALSVLVQALAWAENAGPLMFVMFGLMVLGARTGVAALRGASPWTEPSARWQWALTAWALVWLLVFCLPSQRSARYVIPAMPALAVLIALNWQRLGRGWFLASITLCVPVLWLLGRIAHAMQVLGMSGVAEWAVAMVLLAAGSGVAVAAWVRPAWTRACTVALGAFVYALLNATLAPLSGPAGHFDVQAAMASGQLKQGAHVAVPSGFNAQHERYRFLLPATLNARISDFAVTRDESKLAPLLAHHDAVVWQVTANGGPPTCASGTSPSCRVVAQRWDVRSRHQAGEIRADNLLHPEQWAFGREWLLVPVPAR